MKILIFIIVTSVFLLIGGLVYLIYLPFKKRFINNGSLTPKKSKLINTFYFSLVMLISAYFTFEAIYPGKKFYKDEFRKVTQRDIPESAEFIKKSASYPDFHGDYCSSSQIRLSKADYQKLLRQVKTDTLLTENGELIYSDEFEKALDNKKATRIIYSYTRQIEGK
ncbi:MAG: hypothetical protein GXC73_18125, partial [Chitinophagaceae bacterium]|nr:hypothetical protein [Chitinophagaceae bacterium]